MGRGFELATLTRPAQNRLCEAEISDARETCSAKNTQSKKVFRITVLELFLTKEIIVDLHKKLFLKWVRYLNKYTFKDEPNKTLTLFR
jgi:hypothetical protein